MPPNKAFTDSLSSMGAVVSTGRYDSLERSLRKKKRGQVRSKPFWEPNPCWVCSKGFSRPATGTDPRSLGGREVCPYCNGSKYGPQAKALTAVYKKRNKAGKVISVEPIKEILMGGARGGAKSNTAIIFLLKGNNHLPQFTKDGKPILVNQSYLYHSSYRALILRRSQKDLQGFVSEARKYFKLFGGRWIGGSASMFKFPSGAEIWTGHLDSENAFEKYLGIPELHRVVVEELTLVHTRDLYDKLLTSVRSTHEELITQIFCTTNPIGKGLVWVKDYFHSPPNPNKPGEAYKPGEVIISELENPFTKEAMEQTRIFIPATLQDNPHLLKNADYVAALQRLPSEDDRKALMHGDWNVLAGVYFKKFRDGTKYTLPINGEPENASHVVILSKNKPKLEPWYHRAMGGDW